MEQIKLKYMRESYSRKKKSVSISIYIERDGGREEKDRGKEG